MSHVAVIGAGPMGLAVAYHLLKSGQQVSIFEADSKVGGMSATFDFDGVRIERYYHFICGPDQPLFELLEELEIKDKLRWTDTKMGFYFQGALYEWGNPIALLKFPKLDMISKLRYGLLAFSSTKRNNWKKLDHIDAVSWLTKWLGQNAYDILWKSLFELKFYHFTSNLSAAWIWTRIRRVGLSRKSMMIEQMGYMEGGSETIVNRLQTVVEEMGGRIHLNAPVEQILIDDNRVTGVRLGGREYAFDRVVSTVPIPYVNRMIPGLPENVRRQFDELHNIAVVCILVKLSKPVTENFWLNINDARMDIPGIVEYTNLNPLGSHIVYVPYYMPADHPLYQDADEIFFTKVRSYLKMINPEIHNDDILAMSASRYRHAQPICEPGFLSKLPPIQLPVTGLYVADTSYYYPEDRSICESVKLGKAIAQQLTNA